jgi:hypothetical protein|uniref:DUF4402 domain-containing protein n=1 Tax=Altererythrobacter segetis TaxID=1104773 RepID=UPI00140869E7|nr:DUF4402 domain-containing protein [Altererythrobacter segetis]
MGPGIIRLPRLGACSAPWLQAGACALLAAFLFVPSHAFAQQVDGDTATARTQVAILTPGSVAKISDMDFGSIAQANTGGTIVLTPQNTATCTATGVLIRTGACKAAAFSIYGKKNKRVFIRENNGGQITLNGPAGATMQLTNLTVGVLGMSAKQGAAGWDFGSWRVDTPTGIAEFYVGGTLNVAAAQTPGVYNGTLLIQIQFN